MNKNLYAFLIFLSICANAPALYAASSNYTSSGQRHNRDGQLSVEALRQGFLESPVPVDCSLDEERFAPEFQQAEGKVKAEQEEFGYDAELAELADKLTITPDPYAYGRSSSSDLFFNKQEHSDPAPLSSPSTSSTRTILKMRRGHGHGHASASSKKKAYPIAPIAIKPLTLLRSTPSPSTSTPSPSTPSVLSRLLATSPTKEAPAHLTRSMTSLRYTPLSPASLLLSPINVEQKSPL